MPTDISGKNVKWNNVNTRPIRVETKFLKAHTLQHRLHDYQTSAIWNQNKHSSKRKLFFNNDYLLLIINQQKIELIGFLLTITYCKQDCYKGKNNVAYPIATI